LEARVRAELARWSFRAPERERERERERARGDKSDEDDDQDGEGQGGAGGGDWRWALAFALSADSFPVHPSFRQAPQAAAPAAPSSPSRGGTGPRAPAAVIPERASGNASGSASASRGGLGMLSSSAWVEQSLDRYLQPQPTVAASGPVCAFTANTHHQPPQSVVGSAAAQDEGAGAEDGRVRALRRVRAWERRVILWRARRRALLALLRAWEREQEQVSVGEGGATKPRASPKGCLPWPSRAEPQPV
jgi:hypothetical protein